MKIIRKRGDTSNILQVFIQDSSSTTGAGLTGLLFNTASLTAYYHKDTDTTATAIVLVTMTVGTFTSLGFKEIDATNMPGWYQFCPPDAAFSTSGTPHSVAFHLKGATNMAPLPIECQLVAYDLEDTVRLGLTGIPNATPGAAGGIFIAGTNAATTITSSGGDALTLSSTGTNGNGLNVSGNGSGHGIKTTGGATGHGVASIGGATSGDGINSVGSTSGHGLTATGVGTTKHGINATGGSTTSHGISATGGGVGHGILATSGGGATGDGIKAVAVSTAGNGMNLLGTTTGNGLLSTGGASAGGDGAEFAAGGGVDVRGNITGNLTGTVSTVTTVTNQLTAAQIAAGVWQDTTAGDFTTGLSIGKSVMNGVSLGTGLTVAAVSGAVGSVTGAVGSVTGAVGSVTGAVGSVTGAVGSVTGNVGGNVVGSVASVTARVTANADQWAGGTIPAPTVTGVPLVDLKYILGTVLTETAGQIAAAFKKFFNIATPASTMDSLTLVATATNLTNAPTAGDLTATMKTSVTTAATAATPVAASVTGAVGSVTGNVGGNVTGSVGSVVGAVGSVTGAVGSVTGNVGGNVVGSVASVTAGCTLTSSYDFAKGTVAMSESYAADGVAPTPSQALFLIQQKATEMSVASTTMTVKKLDGSTTAATFTLDSATAPTSITRTT